jgi:hypothetical protein
MSESNIVDFRSFKEKKEIESDISRGRKPLHMSHSTGKLHGSPYLNNSETEDFGNRMQRIKSSLEKINSLMSELKAKGKSKN